MAVITHAPLLDMFLETARKTLLVLLLFVRFVKTDISCLFGEKVFGSHEKYFSESRTMSSPFNFLLFIEFPL